MAKISGYSNMDYSSMFGSSTSGSNSLMGLDSSMLSDYASIRNGSYGKLTKAYYAKPSNNAAKLSDEENSAIKEAKKANTKTANAGTGLKNSAEAISSSKTLFDNKVEKTDKDGNKTSDYDFDKIYNQIKSFADSYNDVIKQGGDSNNKTVLRNTLAMTNATKANANLLSKVGITIGEDNKLSVNEDDLKKANISDLKSLFSGSGSYADSIATKAQAVSQAAAKDNTKLNTYTNKASYSAFDTNGYLYDLSY